MNRILKAYTEFYSRPLQKQLETLAAIGCLLAIGAFGLSILIGVIEAVIKTFTM